MRFGRASLPVLEKAPREVVFLKGKSSVLWLCLQRGHSKWQKEEASHICLVFHFYCPQIRLSSFFSLLLSQCAASSECIEYRCTRSVERQRKNLSLPALFLQTAFQPRLKRVAEEWSFSIVILWRIHQNQRLSFEALTIGGPN